MNHTPGYIPRFELGERPTIDKMNALVDGVNAMFSQFMGNGFMDGANIAQNVKPVTRNRWLQCLADVDIPAYAVFGMHNQYDYDNPQRVRARKIGLNSNGSPLTLLTNEGIPLAAGQWGTVRQISYDDEVLIRVDPDLVPLPSTWCGVELDQFHVVNHRHGLTCMGPALTIDGVAVIPVQRSRDPVRVCGCLLQDLPAFDYLTKTLGKSYIGIGYRRTSDSRVRPAPNPFLETLPGYDVFVTAAGGCEKLPAWIVEIWNTHRRSWTAGEFVCVVETMGIGLTIDYVHEDDPNPACLEGDCQSDSSISVSSGSVSESSSDSSSGSGSESDSSGDSSSSGSDSESSEEVIHGCCPELVHDFPTPNDYPATLNVTITGTGDAACLARTDTAALMSAFGLPDYQLDHLFTHCNDFDCNGTPIIGDCHINCDETQEPGSPNADWHIQLSGFTTPSMNVKGEMFSCNPLHIRFEVPIVGPPVPNPTGCPFYTGSLIFEFTE